MSGHTCVRATPGRETLGGGMLCYEDKVCTPCEKREVASLETSGQIIEDDN